MNSPQIQPLDMGKVNTPVSSEQKKIQLVQELSKGVKISELIDNPEMESKVSSFISSQVAICFQRCGLNKINDKDLKYCVIFLFEEIQQEFSSFTAAEIENAFKNGITGKYGDYTKGLPPVAFVNFLQGYKKEKEEANQSLMGIIYKEKRKKALEERNAEETKSLNNEFLQNKYQEFCELVQEGEKMVNNSQNISFNLSPVEISSYLSSIQHEGKLLISTNQMNWINDKIDSMKFDFDPYQFGTGAEAKTSFDNHKKSEKHKAFKVLQLEMHFSNAVAKNTGVSITSFFTFSY